MLSLLLCCVCSLGAGVACILIIIFIVLFIKYGRCGRKDVQDGGKGASKYNDSDGFDQLPAYSSLHIYANPADRQQQTSCAQTAALDTATAAATTTATHNGTAVHGNSGRNSLATAGESMNPAYTAHDIDQKTDGSATADGHYDSTNHAPLQPAVASNAIGGDSPQGRYSHLRHSVNSSTKAGGDKEPANPQDVYSHLHEQPKESTNQYDSPKGAANAYASPKPTSAACADNGEGTYNTLQRADGAYDNLELKKDNVYSTLQQQSSADDTAVTTSP
eukprot:scpid82774/ scgid4913/ 